MNKKKVAQEVTISKKTLKEIAQKIGSAFELAMNEGQHKETVDPSRVNRLRVSGFPFCHIRWFFDLPRSTVKARYGNSASRYFTNVGHVLHGTVQDALVTVGLDAYDMAIIGDWKCKKCGNWHRITAKPDKCSKCGEDDLKNEEISLSRGVLTGHIDNVFSFKLKTPFPGWPHKEFWIPVDYKTTSIHKIQKKPTPLPYMENVFQLGGYAGQLHEMGYPVFPLGFLIYVPRDNPWRYRLEPVFVDFEDEARRVATYKKRFIQIASVKDKDDLIEVVDNRPCRKGLISDFDHCKRSATCAGSENRDSVLREMGRTFDKVQKHLPILKDKAVG